MLNVLQVDKKEDQERLEATPQLLTLLSRSYVQLTNPCCLICKVPLSSEMGHVTLKRKNEARKTGAHPLGRSRHPQLQTSAWKGPSLDLAWLIKAHILRPGPVVAE